MSALVMLIVGGWAYFIGPAPAPVESPPAPVVEVAPVAYEATVSAYSCDNHPANTMWPCGPFRDGTRPHSGLHGLVAAGPYEWLGRTVHIEGYGDVRLVDTPRTGWYGNSPHIDLFMGYGAAVNWGIQDRRVYLVE